MYVATDLKERIDTVCLQSTVYIHKSAEHEWVAEPIYSSSDREFKTVSLWEVCALRRSTVIINFIVGYIYVDVSFLTLYYIS